MFVIRRRRRLHRSQNRRTTSSRSERRRSPRTRSPRSAGGCSASPRTLRRRTSPASPSRTRPAPGWRSPRRPSGRRASATSRSRTHWPRWPAGSSTRSSATGRREGRRRRLGAAPRARPPSRSPRCTRGVAAFDTRVRRVRGRRRSAVERRRLRLRPVHPRRRRSAYDVLEIGSLETNERFRNSGQDARTGTRDRRRLVVRQRVRRSDHVPNEWIPALNAAQADVGRRSAATLPDLRAQFAGLAAELDTALGATDTDPDRSASPSPERPAPERPSR